MQPGAQSVPGLPWRGHPASWETGWPGLRLKGPYLTLRRIFDRTYAVETMDKVVVQPQPPTPVPSAEGLCWWQACDQGPGSA